MNRSYRTVWNDSLGAWVAVSEHAAARGKTNSRHASISALALVVMLLGGVQKGWAETTDTSGNVWGAGSPDISSMPSSTDDTLFGVAAGASCTSTPASFCAGMTYVGTIVMQSGYTVTGSDNVGIGSSALPFWSPAVITLV